ncbi:MAG: hypothetical protein WCS60_08590, partial [Hydrogenophaga sp.]
FEAEGIELFPAIRRELRGERSRHFYVLQQGEWPLGMVPPHEQRRREATKGAASLSFAHEFEQALLAELDVRLRTVSGMVEAYADAPT